MHFPLVPFLCAACPLLGACVGSDSPIPDDRDSDPLIPCDAADLSEESGLRRCSPDAEPGYTLFSPLNSDLTWLIDHRGQVVFQWDAGRAPGVSPHLLPTGNLLRPGVRPPNPGDMPSPAGHGGFIEELAPDGAVAWSFDYGGPDYYQHHAVEPLPNGNVLVLAWERKTVEEAMAAGRDPALLRGDGVWPEHIVEVDRAGEIVWR